MRCGAACHSSGDIGEDNVPTEVSVAGPVCGERYSSFSERVMRSSVHSRTSSRGTHSSFSTRAACGGGIIPTRPVGQATQVLLPKRPSTLSMGLTQPQQAGASAIPENVTQRVRITDPEQVYDSLNLGRRIDVLWPSEYMRERGGRNVWRDWTPSEGMEGIVVHRWVPYHKDPVRTCHIDRTILLVRIEDHYVPIAESGITTVGAEV